MPDSSPWLLVPVRSLRVGKSRLAPRLRPDERFALNEFFLRRMLQVAAQTFGLAHTMIVSDGEDALQLAACLGASTLEQTYGGLNEAITFGVRQLIRQCANGVLIVPVDLPHVCATDFVELVSAASTGTVVLCPDVDMQGTNAIYLPSPRELKFQFGPESFARHVLAVERCGLKPIIHLNDRIARDVDTSQDLDHLRSVSGLPASIFSPATSATP